MKKQTVILVLALFTMSVTAQVLDTTSASFLKNHVYYLASDSLKGRMTGTPEAVAAAKYIKAEFEKNGLSAAGDSSFFQKYSFVADVQTGAGNTLFLIVDGKKKELKFSEEFITAPISGKGKAEGGLVFAGYGISSKKLKYDDFDSIDVRGKIVLILRYHPDMNNPHSEFDEYSSFRSKAAAAKEKGAAGVIFVNAKLSKTDEDRFMPFQYDRAPLMKDFPVVQVKREVADALLKSEGYTLDSLQSLLTATKHPHSFAIQNAAAHLATNVFLVENTGLNVIGKIEGTDPVLKNEYIVLGAHYDHLGFGGDGSLYRGPEKLIHNGADDNASGTAGVLELARLLSKEKNNLKRSVLFILFSGEELGLLGSAHYGANTTVPADKIAAMVNLDMVGRLKPDTSLIVYGTGTSSIWKNLVDSLNQAYHFVLTKNDEGYGPSDHSSFYAKNIPVLFFFTGTHTDYHRPGDKADKLNYPGEAQIVSYVEKIALNLANRPLRPDFINVPRKQGERSGGWKVYVGTVPDYAYTGEGLKITGASEGSPAKKAGLQGGDIILQFGSKKINTIYDYVAILRELVPGDVVQVKVKRGEKEISLSVEVGAK